MLCAIVDNRISPAALSRLSDEGCEVITLPPDKRLGAPIASHTDMLIARIDTTLVINRDYALEYPELAQKIKTALPEYEIITDDSPIGCSYPDDCVYNCLVTQDKIYTRHIENPTIADLAQKTGRALVKTKQGYPACTTLLLGQGHAITSDEGMARILSEGGSTVTLIECGDIALPPYEYGFIGGAAGVYGDTVYFAGDIESHRSFDKILTAIENAGMRYVSLCNEALLDVGGILLL